MSFLPPNQQRQSTEGKVHTTHVKLSMTYDWQTVSNINGTRDIKKDLTFLVINKSSMRHWTFIVSGSNDFYQSCMFFDNKHTRHILLRDKMPSATDLMVVGIC